MNETFYVGNLKKNITTSGKEVINIEINLDQFEEFLSDLENKKYIRSWEDKEGNVHRSLRLEAWEMDSEFHNSFRTHSVKVNTFIPESKAEKKADKGEVQEETKPVVRKRKKSKY